MRVHQLTTVGPQHVDHSSWCAHNDLCSSLQLSNLQHSNNGHQGSHTQTLAYVVGAATEGQVIGSPTAVRLYLFADTGASINTHHPEPQWFRELLALLGDLQSQLSGRSHDYSWLWLNEGNRKRKVDPLSRKGSN